MTLKRLILVVLAALISPAAQPASAGQTVEEAGAIACVTDKWDEKEVEKGHKLADAVSRCVLIPDDPAMPKVTEECKGRYEFNPDGSWKASGTCMDTFKNGDTMTLTWEEGSHLKEYTFKKTGGTGKYQGVKGGGTYLYENLTDTLAGGRYKSKIELP